MSGTLYGIGVGPGDPELMTLKAARILASVPVIAYLAPGPTDDGAADLGPRVALRAPEDDAAMLSSEDDAALLSSARRIAASFIPAGRTEIAIRVPMRPGPEPARIYDAAAEEIAVHLDGGRNVAVLCEGDPFFYGSFLYLHDRLAARFKTIVVPGVSSLTACAAAAKRPLARRDEVLTVLPATLSDAALERHLLASDAAAILKVGRHFARVKALLGRLGFLERSRYVAHATRGDEVVLPLAALDAETAPYFSMILVAKGGLR